MNEFINIIIPEYYLSNKECAENKTIHGYRSDEKIQLHKSLIVNY